jgi:hypothetical protein
VAVTKVRRTYNLSATVVAAVKRMVDEGKVAPTQDALVERALRRYARLVRDRAHAERWAQASLDPAFGAEIEDLLQEFESEDRAAWDPA